MIIAFNTIDYSNRNYCGVCHSLRLKCQPCIEKLYDIVHLLLLQITIHCQLRVGYIHF